MRILFVEDEKLLADALKHLFEENGLEAETAYDGDTGLTKALAGDFDVYVLDIMLPGSVDGIGILKELRRRGNRTPVLMLTAKDSLEDKVNGLSLGADDYLVKPFESDELLARVHALYRRSAEEPLFQDIVHFKTINLNKERNSLETGEKEIGLTNKESALLNFLIESYPHPVRKEKILESVWKDSSGVTENSVELYIHYLRKKLEESGIQIKTIRGQGYLLAER